MTEISSIEIYEIPQSSSKPYFALALIQFFLALLSLALLPYISPAFVGLGILALQVKGGMQLDLRRKSIRYFKRFGKNTWGAWKSLKAVTRIELTHSKQTSDIGNGLNGAVLSSNVKTYNLILVGTEGKRKEWHEFVNYKDARQTLLALWKHLKIPCNDRIQEARAASMAKRHSRRR